MTAFIPLARVLDSAASLPFRMPKRLTPTHTTPKRTRTPPCDGLKVSKRDENLPIGFVTNQGLRLTLTFLMWNPQGRTHTGRDNTHTHRERQREGKLRVPDALPWPYNATPCFAALPSDSEISGPYLLGALCVILASTAWRICCYHSRLGRFRAPYAAPGVRREARPSSRPRRPWPVP